MTKYLVNLTTDASFVIKVEAENATDAYDLAYDQVPNLCYSCASIDMSDWQDGDVTELDENGDFK